VPGLHPEADQGPQLQGDAAAAAEQGARRPGQAQPGQRVRAWTGGQAHHHHEGYRLRHAEHRLGFNDASLAEECSRLHGLSATVSIYNLKCFVSYLFVRILFSRFEGQTNSSYVCFLITTKYISRDVITKYYTTPLFSYYSLCSIISAFPIVYNICYEAGHTGSRFVEDDRNLIYVQKCSNFGDECSITSGFLFLPSRH
jgi:hypothetical protein